MITTTDFSRNALSQTIQLKKLTPEQVRCIDEALASLCEYGEVRLVVQRGELRYINKLESFKVCGTESEG